MSVLRGLGACRGYGLWRRKVALRTMVTALFTSSFLAVFPMGQHTHLHRHHAHSVSAVGLQD